MALADFPRYPLPFGPSPVHPLDRLTDAPRRCTDLGQAGGLQLRPGVRRQQDPQARVPRPGRAGTARDAPGVDRRSAVQPHPAGRRGRGQDRLEGAAGAGELGRLARRRERPGRQHPAVADHGRPGRTRRGGVRHRLQAELGKRARRDPQPRWRALRHPRRRIRPPPRWPRLRQLGRTKYSSRSRNSASSSTRSSSAP